MLAQVAPSLTLAEALLHPSVPGERSALFDVDGAVVSFADLRSRVRERSAAITLPPRSLVILVGDRSIEFVVTYLALLDAGHVPVLAGDRADRIGDAWAVGGVVTATAADVVVEPTRNDPVDLHPDLALLVSTSGSTGSPKLVRLSHRNLVSNAMAIAEYLRLGPDDRGITSLPLHYCYGLSVLHSHLAVGAGVVLTDLAVVDRCFRRAVRDQAVTNLAGVPHTFDLLERSGADELAGSSLRLLTQAGGRMAPDSVTRWGDRARSWGADFIVMYGQSEATARIAYLPPDLIGSRPEAVGRPIPGGSIELRPVDGQPVDVGELVYRGPNVMMGYACDHADLALGHTLDELATGDLARHHADDDVYEIVGRRSRFVKPFGLRIDLDEVEAELATVTTGELAVAGDDERIVVHAPGVDCDAVAARLGEITGLPEHCREVRGSAVPRTSSGKVDQAAMLAADAPAAEPSADSVPEIFARVLGLRSVHPSDSFVSLGGDSLSYVECSIRLEAALGRLPSDWHLQPISALTAATSPRRRLARLDTTVALRALGICLVVSTHMRVRHLPGGAHVLLAVAGYNLARFMMPLPSATERLRAGLRTAGRAAIPTMIWVGVGMLLFGAYSTGTLLLVNNYVGAASHDTDHWHFWFIEVFVHLVLLAALVSAIPIVHRLDRRFAYVFPLAVLGATLLLRVPDLGDWYNLRFRTHGVAWFFALGWVIQRSTTWAQRASTSVIVVASVLGYFHVAPREWRIVALLLVLVWVRDLPVPRWSVRPIGTLAAASMWIYVSHFAIWPVFRSVFIREVAYVCTIAAGVGVWWATERLLGLLNTWRQAGSHRPLFPRPVVRGIT